MGNCVLLFSVKKYRLISLVFSMLFLFKLISCEALDERPYWQKRDYFSRFLFRQMFCLVAFGHYSIRKESRNKMQNFVYHLNRLLTVLSPLSLAGKETSKILALWQRFTPTVSFLSKGLLESSNSRVVFSRKIDVFCSLFDRFISICTMISLYQLTKYFNFLFEIIWTPCK